MKETLKPKMSEQQLVNGIIAYLRIHGHYVWRQNTGGMYTKDDRFVRFGYKGISDIIGINGNDGKFIAIECKIGHNKPTEFQQEFLKEVADRGGYAILAYGYQDIEGVL